MERDVGSKSGFLRTGIMAAVLRTVGTDTEKRHVLIAITIGIVIIDECLK